MRTKFLNLTSNGNRLNTIPGPRRKYGIVIAIVAIFAANIATAATVTFNYDEAGRVLTRNAADGRAVERFTYNANGDVISITDAAGRVTRYEYDALRRKSKTTDPAGSVTHYIYDAGDNLIRVTDPRGLVTEYTNNGFGETIRQSSPDTGSTNFTYNTSGLLAKAVRHDGSILEYAYDSIGRLTEVKGGLELRRYSYDTCLNGRLCEAWTIDNGVKESSVKYTYTQTGLLSSQTDTVMGVQDVTRYAHDNLGRTRSITYPNGALVTYTYDLGLVSSISVTDQGTTSVIVNQIRYYPFGPPRAWSYGNGLQLERSYDEDARLSGIRSQHTSSGLKIQDLSFVFDSTGEVSGITNHAGSPGSQSYGYDAAGRLSRNEISGLGVHQLSYDSNGNRTYYKIGSSQDISVISRTSNQLTSMSGGGRGRRHHYDYDQRGNRKSDSGQFYISLPGAGGTPTQPTHPSLPPVIVQPVEPDPDGRSISVTTAITYDPFNRIKTISRGMPVDVCDQYGACKRLPAGTAAYEVNALDRPASRSGMFDNSRYIYANVSQRLAEHRSSGWTNYIWLDNELVGVIKRTTGTTAGFSGVGFVHNDQLGRPEVVTSSSRTPIWRANNYAFDRHVEFDQIGGLALGLPGQYYDDAADLWSNGFRDYDAKSGRYLQSDPMGVLAGVNTYAYVGGNPVGFIDPLGLARWTGTIIIGGGGRTVIGGGIARLNLQSECLNGEQASVSVNFIGGGLAVGSPVSATVSRIELTGGLLMFIDPNELVGKSSILSIGAAVGGGPALSSIKIGNVSSIGAGGQAGWDASAMYLWGSSEISGGEGGVSWNRCGCSE